MAPEDSVDNLFSAWARGIGQAGAGYMEYNESANSQSREAGSHVLCGLRRECESYG